MPVCGGNGYQKKLEYLKKKIQIMLNIIRTENKSSAPSSWQSSGDTPEELVEEFWNLFSCYISFTAEESNCCFFGPL